MVNDIIFIELLNTGYDGDEFILYKMTIISIIEPFFFPTCRIVDTRTVSLSVKSLSELSKTPYMSFAFAMSNI